MNKTVRIALAATALIILPIPSAVLAAPAVKSAAMVSEDARFTAFLDNEFAQELKLRPQLATRLGIKDGEDLLDDNSDAGALKRLQWRRASV